MSSFYGGAGVGVSQSEVIQIVEDLLSTHIAFSVTQPEDQQVGDIWVILKQVSDD